MSDDGVTAAPVDSDAITYRWDLDKTYLRTEFESLRRMVRIPFEAGADKVHLPGVPQLIRGLRRCAESSAARPYVFFLSASPPQIGAAIREKLAIDEIEYDGITFKNQLGHLVRGRFGKLREQVGYKLGELLAARIAGPAAKSEYLFGDDWESDPLIYSLYADILEGAIDEDLLTRVLSAVEVGSPERGRILKRAEALSGTGRGVVVHIYINLERRTPPSRFQSYGRRVVPTFNTMQAAASLFEVGRLEEAGVMDVARSVIESPGEGGHRLRNSVDDLTRRGHLRLSTRDKLIRALARARLAPLTKDEAALRARLRATLARFRRAEAPEDHPRADYEALLENWETEKD